MFVNLHIVCDPLQSLTLPSCFVETRTAAVCTNRDIRLQDGLISSEFGRVEVCFNGQWGVVCNHNHFFDDLDAAVACRQLGIEGR